MNCTPSSDALGNGPKGGFTGGSRGGYRRLEQRLGGNAWRAQTGRRAVGGGHRRLPRAERHAKGGGGGPFPPSYARNLPLPQGHRGMGAGRVSSPHTFSGALRLVPQAWPWAAGPRGHRLHARGTPGHDVRQRRRRRRRAVRRRQPRRRRRLQRLLPRGAGVDVQGGLAPAHVQVHRVRPGGGHRHRHPQVVVCAAGPLGRGPSPVVGGLGVPYGTGNCKCCKRGILLKKILLAFAVKTRRYCKTKLYTPTNFFFEGVPSIALASRT